MTPFFLSACIALHNICIQGGDDGDWLGDDVQADPEDAGHELADGIGGGGQAVAQRRAGVEKRNDVIRLFACQYQGRRRGGGAWGRDPTLGFKTGQMVFRPTFESSTDVCSCSLDVGDVVSSQLFGLQTFRP